MRLKWPLVQHSSHKWKQIRDRDYHHFWSGCQRLVKFQILRIFVWTMACHNYYLSGWKLGHLEELIHSEFHPSQKESFWLWSRNETSETTWSVLKPYRELLLSDPTTIVWTPSDRSRLWSLLYLQFYLLQSHLILVTHTFLLCLWWKWLFRQLLQI